MSGTSEFLLFEPHVRVIGGRQIEFKGKMGEFDSRPNGTFGVQRCIKL